jgi:hypothetical protein
MIIDNTSRIKQIKRLFYLLSGMLVISAILLLYLDQIGRALIAGGVLVIWFLVFQAIDFQYFYLEIASDKLTVRFYPAVKFGRKDYQTIEFTTKVLHDFVLEKSLFGLVNDLTLLVKTKRGVAEYPSISLAAVSKEDRNKIEKMLRQILHR